MTFSYPHDKAPVGITSKWYSQLSYLIIIFFILYDFELSFFPYFTSGRVAFIILLVTTYKRVLFDKFFYWGAVIFGLTLIYSVLQSLYSSDSTQSLRLLWFFIYGWFLPHILINNFEKHEQIFSVIFLAVSLQAIVVLIMFFNIDVRDHILQMIRVHTTILEESKLQRAFGFTSLTGASFSIVQSLGIFSGLYHISLSVNKSSFCKMLSWTMLIIVLFSIILVGRTGLIISFFFLGYYFLFISNLKGKISLVAILLFLFQIDISQYFKIATESIIGFNPDWFIEWVKEAFNFKNNSTVDELNKMFIPPVTIETIVGTGRVEAEYGDGNASLNDSGFIQTYYSLGLIMAFVFYATFFCLSFYKWYIGRREPFILMLLLLTFIVEYKEPFIFKYSLTFVLSTFLICEAKFKKS